MKTIYGCIKSMIHDLSEDFNYSKDIDEKIRISQEIRNLVSSLVGVAEMAKYGFFNKAEEE